MLQCVVLCCSVMQSGAVYCSALQRVESCVAACCSVLQRVAACCSVLQRVAACVVMCCSVLQCAVVCCSVLQSKMLILLLSICKIFLYEGVWGEVRFVSYVSLSINSCMKYIF